MRTQQEGLFADGLRSYVREVARALRVEPEAAWCEVAESSTAYVAVRERSSAHPDKDVMLLWDEKAGWLVALEPKPGERPIVLGRVGGDVVPEPVAVARAVGSALRDGKGMAAGVRTENADLGQVRAQILAYALPR